MRRFSTWMLVMFMVLFWILRVVITLMTELKMDLMEIVPMNKSIEIILLFVALLCIVLVVKRKWIGSVIYLIAYVGYFGTDFFQNIDILLNATETLEMGTYINIIFSFFGVLLPIFVLFDMILDKDKSNNPKDKKTDWFYTNEQYDRKMDERADKNNYRTL